MQTTIAAKIIASSIIMLSGAVILSGCLNLAGLLYLADSANSPMFQASIGFGLTGVCFFFLGFMTFINTIPRSGS